MNNILETYGIRSVNDIADLVKYCPDVAIKCILLMNNEIISLQEHIDNLNSITDEGLSFLGSYVAKQCEKANNERG